MDRNRPGSLSKWTLATRIVAERREVQARLAALDRQSPARATVGGGDNTPASEIMEAAQDSVLRDLAFTSRAVLVSRLKQLVRAEAKIREGTYGRCDACNGPISMARLRALPEAVRCVRCANHLLSVP